MISARKKATRITNLAETKIQKLKNQSTIQPMEAFFIFNTDENEIVKIEGWENLNGTTKQKLKLKTIISSISPEYQNFSAEIIEKSIVYYKNQKIDLLDHWCQFDLTILHKNGITNSVIDKPEANTLAFKEAISASANL